jgi:hypothetical protein
MNDTLIQKATEAMQAWREWEAESGHIVIPYPLYRRFLELEVAIEQAKEG